MSFHFRAESSRPCSPGTVAGIRLKSPLCLFALAWLLAGSGSQAQTYALDWSALSGGGGVSTGGGFTASATIGQLGATFPEQVGGPFSLLGGFWSFVGVQTPGSPRLSITRNGPSSAVIISWPSPSSGFVLQLSSDLTGNVWVPVPQVVTDNGTTKSVVLNVNDPPAGNRFYRLRKP
jgi:hypothetical protein